MRPLLRRALAIAVVLSVMLSTLGAAGARCDAGAGSATAGATHGTHDMAGMPDDGAEQDGRECGHEAGAPAHGGAACLLVAHCGATPAVPSACLVLALGEGGARQASDDEARPHERPSEPDSPPPRG